MSEEEGGGAEKEPVKDNGKKQKCPAFENHERWLVSYADFITLLFATFVALYALNLSDPIKIKKVAEYMRLQFGEGNGILQKMTLNPLSIPGEGIEQKQGKNHKNEKMKNAGKADGKKEANPQDMAEIRHNLKKFLEKNGLKENVNFHSNERGLTISIKDGGMFGSGSADIQGNMDVLSKIANQLKPYTNAIRVEGHTDNVGVSGGQYRDNWELSSARATKVLQELVNTFGVPPDKVSAVGYADNHPVADNDTEEGRRKNRRVDIVVLSAEGSKGEPN
jgi:chemotaxis protein MotB